MQNTLYIFQLSTTKDEFSVTTDRSGANLPRGEHITGTWRFVAEVPATEIPEMTYQAKEVIAAIEDHGYTHLERKYRKPHSFYDKHAA